MYCTYEGTCPGTYQLPPTPRYGQSHVECLSLKTSLISILAMGTRLPESTNIEKMREKIRRNSPQTTAVTKLVVAELVQHHKTLTYRHISYMEKLSHASERSS